MMMKNKNAVILLFLAALTLLVLGLSLLVPKTAPVIDRDIQELELEFTPSSALPAHRHEPLNALLNVPEMKTAFLNRVAEIMEKHFSWPDVRAVFDQWESDIGAILPRHIDRWKNLTMEKWDKNIRSARYYARVRPLKVPALLKDAMKLTDAEVEACFGDALRLLGETNASE